MGSASLALGLAIFLQGTKQGRDIDGLAQVETVETSGMEVEDRKPSVLISHCLSPAEY